MQDSRRLACLDARVGGGSGGGGGGGGATVLAPPWPSLGRLQNRGWAAGTAQYLLRDIHAGIQAVGTPGARVGGGPGGGGAVPPLAVVAPPLAPLKSNPKPRLGLGKG
ncbi:hypothetical protein ABPG77_009578 [Micractinium sp. CCAP 211/92]